MKKILSIIAITAAAFTSAQATDMVFFTLWNFGPAITLEDGQTKITTSGTGDGAGYLAAYWWSETGGTDLANYSVLGISTMADCLGDDFLPQDKLPGLLYFQSEGIIIAPTNNESFIAMTIFRYDIGVDEGWSIAQWNSFVGGLTVNAWGDQSAQDIQGLWQASQDLWDSNANSNEIGIFMNGKITHGMGGGVNEVPPTEAAGLTNWGSTPHLVAPIPEPSTWLLLGAGAAFVMIFRRRKNA